MSPYPAGAGAGMNGISFRAWRDGHYVTLAELLVRLGSFGLGLTWRVEVDEMVDPRCAEIQRACAGAGTDTLTLLSLTTPGLQLIDARAHGFVGDVLVIVMTEIDSSWWEIRTTDKEMIGELRRRYPDATEL